MAIIGVGEKGDVTHVGEETEVLKEILVCYRPACKPVQLLQKVGLLKIFKLKFSYEPASRLGIDSNRGASRTPTA